MFAMFALLAIVSTTLKNRKRLYSAFIDFKKHLILWIVLLVSCGLNLLLLVYEGKS